MMLIVSPVAEYNIIILDVYLQYHRDMLMALLVCVELNLPLNCTEIILQYFQHFQ